jgi:hypothetical protein
MGQLILMLIMLLLVVGFWGWMFSDMTKNDNLPPCFITITNGRDPRLDWTFMFFFFNMFTALFYYVTVYRNRH